MKNKTQDNFYVYVHINIETNVIFYVGKGNGNRAYAKTRRSVRWTNYTNKHPYRVEFINSNLSDIEALKIEIETIARIGRIDTNTGPLINLTDGGEGASGAVRSEETKNKMSIAAKGKILSLECKEKISQINMGKKLSEETKMKISEANKTAWETRERIAHISDSHKENISKSLKGRKRSEEVKDKIKKAKTGRKHTEETRMKISETLSKKPNKNNSL